MTALVSRILALAALLLVALTGAANAQRDEDGERRAPVRVIVGLDLSQSNPLVDSRSYAASMGGYVADYIQDLPLASQVMLRTFGSYSSDDNNLRIDRSISNLPDEKPKAVAELMRQIIAGVPRMVREGTLDAQPSTNILAFLENMADVVDCGEMDTRILLISDGIEDSEYAHLNRAGEHLPRPSYAMFRGCTELQILGIGQGQRSPAKTERLKDEWAAWARAAGFRRFVGLNSW